MKQRKLLDLIGDIKDTHIAEAEPDNKQTVPSKKGKKDKIFLIVMPIVALVGALLLFISPLMKPNQPLTLENSQGVSVKEINTLPDFSSKGDLIWLSEEELFQRHHFGLEMVAFEGTITETQNIVVNFGRTKDYYAIASIEVSDVLRGNLSEGDIISVLLPNPIQTNVGVSETTYSSQIRTGQKGIFMPVTYDEHATIEMDNKVLVKQDLAPYGFLDGERWMILQTDEGMIYNEEAYPSLAPAQTLSEMKEILKNKLE